MALSSNQLAILTCRAGAARAAAVRSAFVPRDTSDSSGTPNAGPFYQYTRVYAPTTTWTKVTEP